ncbi:MAG: protein kinase [Vicinamibacterales bacterium]
MIGRTVGKYRVVEQVGRGGMGTVYKAVDETLDRTVAIKVLNADLLDQDSVERFRREAVTLARLNHPRIGAIHELTRDGHDLLMVMEFIQGETFEKLIERGAPLSIADAVRLCAQVLDGLQYAHSAGVVHRDLKPANVIVTPSGDIKIMDFGIARVQGSEHLTSVGFMVGTPAYMSPEQVRGEEVDPRMDLYSVAVVLYRLLTHRLPFEGNTAIAMIHSQLSNAPTPARQFRADLPDWIVAALTRGLAKSAGDRFQTASEFRTALEQGLTGKMAIADILGPSHAETMGPTMTPPAMRVPQTQGTGIAAQPAAASSAVRQAPTLPSGTQPTPGSVSAAPPSAVWPQPAATPTASPATVTLRAPHLATAGILVAVLVAGIGVLAFVALRRPAPTPVPATADASGPGTVPLETTPPAAAAPSAPAVVEKPVTPAPAAVPAPSASASNTTGSPVRATTTPAETPARVRSGSPAAPAVATAAPSTPATPAAADAPAEHFADLKILTMDGTKGREVDALLGLEPGTLVVRAKDGRVLRTLTYRSVTAATYARARRPKGQAIPNAIDIPDNFGGSGFLGGSHHWLSLQTAGEFLILRLEDRNVIRIMQAIEARTGLKVVRSQD